MKHFAVAPTAPPPEGATPEELSRYIQQELREIEIALQSTQEVMPAIVFTAYDASPTRGAVTNLHGGWQTLQTAVALNSGAPINVSKGIGKLLIVPLAGTTTSGTITITGTTIDRDTGAVQGGDTDTIMVTGLATDSTTTDTAGNSKHAIEDAYLSSKWFVGSVAISTTDLVLTGVDVHHVSFEQCNDVDFFELDTFDINLWVSDSRIELDAYLFSIEVIGGKCNVATESELHIGTDGQPGITNTYWRLRKGNIGKKMSGSSDGFWVEGHYSAVSGIHAEDVNFKVWAKPYREPE